MWRLILDPMLATGGSAVDALDHASRLGRAAREAAFAHRRGRRREARGMRVPQLAIYVCQIDPDLNDRKFIVPGLGDAGDRIFNTVNE